MEISPQSFTSQPLEQVGTAKGAGGSAPPSVTSQQARQQEDVASLSSGQALSGDDTRVERVRTVQNQIANGTYQVSAQDVASSLLSSLSEGL